MVPPDRDPDFVYTLGPLTIELWQVASNGRALYAYRLFDQEWGGVPVFEADDFKMPSGATFEETALDILSYLVLQADEVEEWFFRDYTPEQLRWRDERGPLFQPTLMEEARRLLEEARMQPSVGSRKKRK